MQKGYGQKDGVVPIRAFSRYRRPRNRALASSLGPSSPESSIGLSARSNVRCFILVSEIDGIRPESLLAVHRPNNIIAQNSPRLKSSVNPKSAIATLHITSKADDPCSKPSNHPLRLFCFEREPRGRRKCPRLCGIPLDPSPSPEVLKSRKATSSALVFHRSEAVPQERGCLTDWVLFRGFIPRYCNGLMQNRLFPRDYLTRPRAFDETSRLPVCLDLYFTSA